VIAAEEIRPADALSSSPAHDSWAMTLSNPAGDLCALTLENFRLRSALSVDGGITFAPEVEAAGGADQPAVFGVAGGTDGADGVYLALQVADPGGHHGLQVVSSTDFCDSWTAPRTLVESGAPSHGVSHIASSVHAPGHWAVYYHGADGEDAFVVASSDGGVTWNAPVRLDDGPPPAGAPVTAGSVLVDATDVIHAAYVELDGGWPHVWYTRSTDDGLSFEAPRRIGDLLSVTGGANSNPHLALAADGSVLLAFWDSAPRLYVARTSDYGLNYVVSYHYDLADPNLPLFPRLFPGNGGEVFLLAPDDLSRLTLHRSLDHGETFSFREFVTSTVYGADSFSMARTSTGKWILAWTDNRDDGYVGDLADVWARASPDLGETWSAEQRINAGDPGMARRLSGASAVTPVGSGDDFLLTYLDDRDEANGICDLYGARGTVTPTTLNMSPDQRIDGDTSETTHPPVTLIPSITTDGADHVYVAFSANVAGPYPDVYVSSSGDGGYTFSIPVRVGDLMPPGQALDWFPALAALPDGNVVVAWLGDDPGGTGREIHVATSPDHGASWTNDYVLGTLDWPAGYEWTLDWPALQVAATTGGRFYVVAANGENVYLARSITGGFSWEAPEEIDQDDRGLSGLPRICVDGDQVVIAFVSPRSANDSERSVWAVVSEDGGVSWTPGVELRGAATGPIANGIDLACGPGGRALASWSESALPGIDDYELRSRLFDGTDWQAGTVAVPAPPTGPGAFWPSAAYAGENEVVLAYQVDDYDIYAARSVDGGASWLSYLRLDDFNPDPGFQPMSYWPRTVSDGAGNVWIAWLDRAAGRPSVVMRHSRDSGASYFLTTRMDRIQPQGAHESLMLPMFDAAAALPGVGFVAWAAVRDNPALYDLVLNAWDIDDYDRDTASDDEDCALADPGAFAVPVEIASLVVRPIAGGDAGLSWPSLAETAGVGTRYDVVTGRLSVLRTDETFVAASCLANDLPAPFFDDDRGQPPPGDGDYYLVRGQNACGPGSFGDSTLAPDPRDDLDGYFTPCP